MDRSPAETQPDVSGTGALAKMIRAVDYDSLPKPAVRAAKRLIVDSLGCMLGGWSLPQGRKMVRLMSPLTGPGGATVAGAGDRRDPAHAACLNAYLANLLDFDDTYFGHPGATAIPPALALAEDRHLSGRRFMTAVVAAYEAGLRVADAIKPSRPRLKKVMGLATWQIFCAAAASAKALGLGPEETVQALSLAGVHAPVASVRKLGLKVGRASWMKNNYGWPVLGGVLAAFLAEDGFVGDPTLFDGPTGFWVMAGSDRFRPAALSGGLPKTWAVERVSLKPYTACRHISPTLDAVFFLVRETKLAPEQIERVEVESFFELAENYSFFPGEPMSVPFSAPCLIALAALGLPPGPAWFDPALLTDPRVRGLAGRVSLEIWPEADRLYSRVKRELISRVTLFAAGRVRYRQEVRIPKGDPRNPLSDEEVRQKFLALAGPVLGRYEAARVHETLMRLEELDDCATLLAGSG
ncbi:MAG: MmgE/PrpD family protein [Deltaproteobacteria bacterium]|nr:MmgE/PrpD family protein [Deltaproteobacteria bacterium]